MGDRGSNAVRVVSFFGALFATMLISGGVALAAAWGPSFPVTPAAIDDLGSQEATVLADEEGTFTYFWRQQMGINNVSIYSRAIRADGSLRDTVEAVVTNGDGTPGDIKASTSPGPGGITHLTFTRTETTCLFGCGQKLQYLPIGPDGEPTAPEQTIDSVSPGSGDFFTGREIATGPQGHTTVTWTIQDVSVPEGVLKAASAPPGEPFGAAVTIPVDGSALSPAPEVTASGEAIIGITYEKNNSPNPATSGFLARSVSLDGTTGPERTIVPESTNSVANPISDIDGTGKVTFAFRQSDGVADRVFFRQMDSGGNVLGASPTLVSDPDALSAEIQPPFGLDVNEAGTVGIAWREFNGETVRDEAWMRTISADGTPGGSSRLSGPDDNAGLPAIALSPAGGGAALFNYFDAGDDAAVIEGLTFDSAGALTGPATRLDAAGDPNDSAYVAGAAFDGNGDAAGLWGFEINAQDGEDEFRSSILDAAAPRVKIFAPPRATAGLEIVIAVDGQDRSPVNYEWTFGDGETASGAITEHRFESTGQFEIELTATDAAGNVTTRTAAIEVLPAFVEPPIAPDTTISAKPKKKTRAKTATFRFLSTLTGSGFECRLDRAGWSTCRSPKKLRKLKPGKHTFQVRAVKGDLFDRSPASFSWTVKR